MKYLVMIIFLFACNQDELLNTVPDTSISAGNAFKTPARILGLVNGAYDGVKSASFYGGRYLLYLDVRGEEFINITANSFTGFESWNNTYTSGSSDVNNLWGAAYTAINLSNILIDGLSVSTGVISDSLKTQYTAEAKFLRALSYYSLVTIYARPFVADQGASKGLPLRIQAETTSANNNLACSSVAEIYTQILADLDAAEAGLPATHGSALLNTTRAHKSTAIALKTRVYLNQGNYAKVVVEAQKLVPQASAPFSTTFGVLHALQDHITTVFNSDYTTTESVFSMPMTELDSYGGQSSIAYIYNTNSEYYLNPSGIYGDVQWRVTDERRSFLRLSSGRYYFQKYAKPSPFLDYIPVIRYAEVLLNYAEAAARTGNIDLSAALLKAVHTRSDPAYVFEEDILGNEKSLVEAIWKERRIELIGEGFRSNDLLRTLQTIPAKGSSSLQAPSVAPSAVNYIFPAPNSELLTNKLF